MIAVEDVVGNEMHSGHGSYYALTLVKTKDGLSIKIIGI